MPGHDEGDNGIFRVDRHVGGFDGVTGGNGADGIDNDFRIDSRGDGIDEELVEVQCTSGDVIEALVADIGEVFEQVDIDPGESSFAFGSEADRVDANTGVFEAVQVDRVTVVGREVPWVGGESARTGRGDSIGEEHENFLSVAVSVGGQQVPGLDQRVGHVGHATGGECIDGGCGGGLVGGGVFDQCVRHVVEDDFGGRIECDFGNPVAGISTEQFEEQTGRVLEHLQFGVNAI